MLAVGAKNLIKKTGPTIVQSSVSGYRLMFVQVRAGLVGDRLVVVILGRQQVRLGEKERFVVECGKKENVKDYVIAIREDLLEQSVNSSEDITQQDDVHGDTWGGDVEVGQSGYLHGSGYACTYSTDVDNIKAAIQMRCDEKAKYV